MGREGLRWGFAGEKAGLVEEEWDLRGGAGTTCFAGKAFFCQGRERGQLLLSNREPGDKGDNKAGRAGARQPGLVPQCPTTWEHNVGAGQAQGWESGSTESPDHQVSS